MIDNKTQKVIKQIGSGGPEVLNVVHEEIPSCKEHQVLIKVAAFGINRPDIFQRKGNYAAPKGVPADIPGLEVSGVIVEVGSKVSQWKIGDQVCALVGGGGYAQFCLAHEDHCLEVKDNLDLVEAAGIPETLFTVWLNVYQNLETFKQLENVNKRLLIHGGSGGIGTMSLSLALYFNWETYTTVGSDERAELCEKLGAHHAVNYKKQDFEEVFKGLNFNLILDSIGGDYFLKNINLLGEDGILVYINAIKGRMGEVNILKIMQKRLKITGSTLRPRTDEFKGNLRDEIQLKVWDAFLKGEIKPVIQEVMDASEIIKAHQKLENGEVFGKLIMKW